mgnify:CR=1 FL=1
MRRPKLFLLDEPLTNPNAVATYLVARQARADGLKVLLTGDGGEGEVGIVDLHGDLSVDDHVLGKRADHDAEDRATLLAAGIVTIPANKAVLQVFLSAVWVYQN